MQSGISVTPELHDAFHSFASDSSIFCLPVTITAESLTPLPTISFSSSHGPEAFYASLPKLSSTLQPKVPVYLLLRKPQDNASESSLVALTYIPSNAPVRAKTIFASTRSTLVRELGSEKFAETIFATDEDEVVGEAVWREREAEGNGNGASAGFRREDLMDEKERELQAVRRAEEEARIGTPQRDIGIGGTFGRGNATSGMRISMPVEEEARAALRELRQGSLVQLAIDIPRETFTLETLQPKVDAGSVSSHISPSSPRYTFYHYPGSEALIFIYTCPSNSSIKERMLYASSRRHAIDIAENEGLKIHKKIEAGVPEDITRERLHEEVYPPQDQGPKRGFAKPRRPGR